MNFGSGWRVAVPALITLALTGCSKPALVGKWQGNVIVPGRSTPGTTTLEVRPDGTMTQSASGVGSFAVDGRYKVEGDKMITDITGMKANNVPVPADIMARIPKSAFKVTMTYKLDGDALTLTELDPLTGAATARTMTLKRVTDEAR